MTINTLLFGILACAASLFSAEAPLATNDYKFTWGNSRSGAVFPDWLQPPYTTELTHGFTDPHGLLDEPAIQACIKEELGADIAISRTPYHYDSAGKKRLSLPASPRYYTVIKRTQDALIICETNVIASPHVRGEDFREELRRVRDAIERRSFTHYYHIDGTGYKQDNTYFFRVKKESAPADSYNVSASAINNITAALQDETKRTTLTRTLTVTLVPLSATFARLMVQPKGKDFAIDLAVYLLIAPPKSLRRSTAAIPSSRRIAPHGEPTAPGTCCTCCSCIIS